MSDHGQLEAFARETTQQVLAPDFDVLRAVSKRRRRAAYVCAGGVAAAVTGLVAIGVQAVGSDQSGPVHPGPATVTTISTPTPGDGAAARIVDDPAARHLSVAVLSENPAAKAVVWQVSDRQVALVVTGDDFETRTCLLLRGAFPTVSAMGANDFFVHQRGPDLVVSPDGRTREVAQRRSRAALEPGEFLAMQRDAATQAVDPASATSHPLALPAQATGAFGDRSLLWTIPTHFSTQGDARSAVSWSTDGGRSWSTHPLPSGPLAIFTPVPSPPGTMVVSETGDGNTLPPLVRLVYSLDAGTTWQTAVQPPGPVAGVSWTAALPDGSLLANVVAWGGDRAGQPGQRVHGLYASVGTEWDQLVPVHPDLPEHSAEDAASLGDLEASALGTSAAALYVSGSPTDDLLVSMDGGHTWRATASR